MGSAPVGVQCTLTSSLFYWAGSGILGYVPPVLLSIVSVFPFTLLHLPLDFIRVSSFWPTYLHQGW